MDLEGEEKLDLLNGEPEKKEEDAMEVGRNPVPKPVEKPPSPEFEQEDFTDPTEMLKITKREIVDLTDPSLDLKSEGEPFSMMDTS